MLNERRVDVDDEVAKIIENLMAFRHVATKIYGFLIDWNKLKFVINDIQGGHSRIKRLILDTLNTMEE